MDVYHYLTTVHRHCHTIYYSTIYLAYLYIHIHIYNAPPEKKKIGHYLIPATLIGHNIVVWNEGES